MHVDEVAVLDAEIESDAAELLDKERHVKLVAVVARNVAALENGMERLGYLRERRAVLHVLVRDMMHGCAFRRRPHLGTALSLPCGKDDASVRRKISKTQMM